MDAERWDQQVGSVADEAARLLESLRRSAEPTAGEATGTPPGEAAGTPPGEAAGTPPGEAAGTPPGEAADEGESTAGAGESASGTRPGTHDPFCTWCPLCRTAEVVRTLSPETITRLADLASLAATVLADLASARTASGGASTAGGAPDAGEPGGAQRRATARRTTPSTSRPIPVRDADDPQEAPRG